jgi:hypothetical protein
VGPPLSFSGTIHKKFGFKKNIQFILLVKGQRWGGVRRLIFKNIIFSSLKSVVQFVEAYLTSRTFLGF